MTYRCRLHDDVVRTAPGAATGVSAPSRRRVMLAGAALAATMGWPIRADAQTSAQGLLRIANPFEFRTLKPSETGFTFLRVGATETLVAPDLDGRIVSLLARSWSVSPDGLEWRLQLRTGIVFHDGSPMTPEAVKASFERLLPQSLYLKAAGIVAIETGADEIVFRLSRPFGSFLDYLSDNSTFVLAPAAFDSQGEVARIIGTGPFRIVQATLPRELTLARHDRYWGRRAAFDSVQYSAVANGETRANIAATGDSDIVLNIPTPSIARVNAGGQVRIESAIIPRTHILMPNCAKPQFSDPRTRQALSLAIDRAGIAASIMRNPALAATQYLAPTLAAWRFPDIPPLRQDVAEARRLLDEAGWKVGPDGVRMKDGVRFAGTVRTFANRPELPVIAAACQSQFKAIGFDLKISVGEFQAITQGQQDGTLELGLSSRNTVIVPDPISTIAIDFTSDVSPAGATGATNWRNDGFRKDVASYLGATEGAERASLRRRIVETLQSELPVIPIVWYDQIVAVNKRVEGFRVDPFEHQLRLEHLTMRS